MSVLRSKEMYEEALALYRLLIPVALVEGQTQLALTYRHQVALLLLRTGRAQEALDGLQQILEETLSGEDHDRVPVVLVTMHWSLSETTGQGLPQSVVDETLRRLRPGDALLETLLLAARRYPSSPQYFAQGLKLAEQMDRPLVAAAFLLRQGRIEGDPQTAHRQRRQARELVADRDLRGVGGAWFGYEIGRSPFAAGLDTDDDTELRTRLAELLKSGRNDSEISEITRSLLSEAADRRTPWIWIQPLFDGALERSQRWSNAEKASVVAEIAQRLQGSWAEPKYMGQASSFAPRPRTIAEALGATFNEQPGLVEEVFAGRAELERKFLDPKRAADPISTLASLLAFLGRASEAEDLFRAASKLENETNLGRLRDLGQLAQLEYFAGAPTAVDHFQELAHTDLEKDYSRYDQTWRRATELAWVSLEQKNLRLKPSDWRESRSRMCRRAGPLRRSGALVPLKLWPSLLPAKGAIPSLRVS